MISYFESSVRINPDSYFLDFVMDDGSRLSYTYRQARLISAALARRLYVSGVKFGDAVIIDLPNCPEFVFSFIACAYAGLSMVMLDHTLTESEKLSRILEVERSGIHASCRIDEEYASELLGVVRDLPEDDSQIVKSIFAGVRHSRAIMGEDQDIVDDVVHYAERASRLLDDSACACIIFVGGKSKNDTRRARKVKAVPLSWANLVEASAAVNDAIGSGKMNPSQERLPFNSFSSPNTSSSFDISPECIWQCVQDLGTIGGIQSLVRAIIAKAPIYLYAENSAEYILNDAERTENMFIALDDEMLQDLLTVEEWRADALLLTRSRLSNYKCVLLADNRRNARTIYRAYDLGAPIFACHGLVEAAGIAAIMRVTSRYSGGVLPLDGYSLEIIDPDEDGFGKLALRGPGVFSGYLNSQTAFTVDHYFITEERAAYIKGFLYWKHRSENMFVSCGQNIYPVEIADVLRHVQGVSGVHVFGVKDSRCGMLPVAAIERSDPTLTSDEIANITRQWFSSITVPISIFVFDQLPRNSKGKLDRPAIEALF